MYTPIRFEDLLDSSIAAIQERSRTIEDCLTLYPAQRDTLEPLLRLAVRLQAARTLQAPPEFRRTAVAHMRAWTTDQPRKAGPTIRKPTPRRAVQAPRLIFGARQLSSAIIIISVLIAILLLVGSGTAYAAADALPGDMLYPLKTAIEDVRLAVSLNDTSDAQLRLDFAARRLDEATALLKANRSEDVGQALTNYTVQIESTQAFLNEGSSLSPAERLTLAGRLATNLAHYDPQLALLLNQVPEAIRPTVGLAMTTSETALNRALEVMGQEPDTGAPEPLPIPIQSLTPTPASEPPTPVPTLQPTLLTPSPELPAFTPRPSAPTSSPRPPTWLTSPVGLTPSAWPMPPVWPTMPAWPTFPVWPTMPAWPTPPAALPTLPVIPVPQDTPAPPPIVPPPEVPIPPEIPQPPEIPVPPWPSGG